MFETVTDKQLGPTVLHAKLIPWDLLLKRLYLHFTIGDLKDLGGKLLK